MIGVGDLVRWKSEIHKNGVTHRVTEEWPHDKMVTLDHHGRVSVGLLEVVQKAAPVALPESYPGADLMQVIEAQMAEIDRLVGALQAAEDDRAHLAGRVDRMEAGDTLCRDDDFDRYAIATEDLLGQLCIALGFDRHPLQPTGIPELDALVRYVMD